MSRTLSNTDDIIDSRDVIARIEELQRDLEAAHDDDREERADEGAPEDFDEWLSTWASDEGHACHEDAEELRVLKALADECEGIPDWEHGATLIHESHWVDYVEDMVKDIGDLPRDIPDYLAIDWEKTADNVSQDYTTVSFDGEDFYVRNC